MALDLFTPDGFFNPSMTRFTIVNSYSTKGRSNNTRSVPCDLIFASLPSPRLTLGHFNSHYPTTDPLRRLKEDELATSVPDFNKATELGFPLLNTPGVYTQSSMSLIGQASSFRPGLCLPPPHALFFGVVRPPALYGFRSYPHPPMF